MCALILTYTGEICQLISQVHQLIIIISIIIPCTCQFSVKFKLLEHRSILLLLSLLPIIIIINIFIIIRRRRGDNIDMNLQK
jgi:hypothetical protein